MKMKLLPVIMLLMLSACGSRHQNLEPGKPENLLDRATEQVSLPLGSEDALEELTGWINKDQPSHADLQCDPHSNYCASAEDILSGFSVPISSSNTIQEGQTEMVILSYDKISAHDCDNFYVSNQHNMVNANHPTFGCSNAANMVQMVTEYNQFTNPSLSGFQSAEQAIKSIKKVR